MKKIKLTQGKYALVDDEDFKYLSKWKWNYQQKGYAVRSEWKGGKTKNFLMHRVILNAQEGHHCDHINTIAR